MDGAVGEARVARVVRHHADRRALTMKLVEELHYRFPVLRVEVPGGLVGEQDGGLATQRSRHRYALLLAARKLRWVVLHPVRHPDFFQRLGGPRLALRTRHPAVSKGQLDIFVNVQVADQVEALEDKADFTVADARPLTHVEILDLFAVQPIFAVRGRVQQTQERKQRRLAATRGPSDGHKFAGLYVQM